MTIICCAWCDREYGADKQPIGEPRPELRTLESGVSHGICAECRPAFVAEIKAAHKAAA